MSSDTDTSNSYDPVESGEESVDLGDSGEEWGDVRSVSCARKYMWLNISFILIQSNLTYSSNAIALNLENQPIKTGEYCNISLPFFFFFFIQQNKKYIISD